MPVFRMSEKSSIISLKVEMRMQFKVRLSSSRQAIDDLAAVVAETPGMAVISAEDMSPAPVSSPLSLVEATTLSLAVYAATFEPVMPLLRRLLDKKAAVVITTRYGSVRIEGDAPLTHKQLMDIVRPLLPR